jgi:hypothetical protein
MANYPAIPEPTNDPNSLRDSVLALKQAFEILSGQKGVAGAAAVTAASAAATTASLSAATTALAATVSAGATYTQSETGAVSSPLISRFTNTLFAHEFGAIGDDSTNDATALQAFLTAVATSGKEGRFDPGKSYFVSGADLLLAPAAGTKNTTLYGFGSQIRTDPTQARTGLKIQKAAGVTRADETRKVIVDGLRVSQFQDANALWGFVVIGSTFVTLRDCTVICGSDSGVTPYVNYAAYYFTLSNPVDPSTGSFWCSMDTCAVKGAVTPTPVGVRIDGQCNAMHISDSSFANATANILFARPSLGLNADEASLANGVRIAGCDFEGVGDAIKVAATPGWSTLPGLMVYGCRAESLTNFLNLNNLDLNATADKAYPILRQNYISSSVTSVVNNPNNLIVDSDGPSIPYAPVITSTGGTLTTVTAAGAYKLIGKQVSFSVTITVANIGSGTGKFNLPLPVGAAKRAFMAPVSETAAIGKAGTYVVFAGAATGTIAAYDNSTNLMVNGYSILVSGSYEIS